MEKNKKGLILIVDDVLKNIQLLGNVLQNEGYDISFAISGEQALTIVENIKPDLILLDIMMPGIDGFEVCKQLQNKEKSKDIPIIFLSAKIETDDIVNGFKIGAVDYITKPFIQEELLARVNTHFELKKNRDMIASIKEKEMFNAMVVTANHQIRQPLTTLQGSVDLIFMYKDEDIKNGFKTNPKIYDFLDKIKRNVTRIASILDKLKEIDTPQYKTYLNNENMIDLDD